MLEPAAGLKIRQEYFDGIAFNAETGLSADLDKAAFRMLAVVVENTVVREADLLGILPSPGTKEGSPTAAHKVLSQLVKL